MDFRLLSKNLIRRTITLLLVTLMVPAGLLSCNTNESSSNPSDCVRSMLKAMKADDIQEYKKVFYYEPDISQVRAEKGFGVIRLAINDIEESKEETNWFIDSYTGSELAKKRNWTDEFIGKVVAIKASYTIDFDNTINPSPESDITQVFFVVRDQESGLWKILEAKSP